LKSLNVNLLSFLDLSSFCPAVRPRPHLAPNVQNQ
jgi:hypothetical protein